MTQQDTEPSPQSGAIVLEPWDFAALAEGRSRDPELNERRLAARRRLLALGKRFVPRAKELGASLEARTSLHHPHAFNGGSVRRMWTYLARGKSEKARLKRVLGSELGRDLDSAYRNATLCVALESEAIEVSFRLHQEAWYDGQYLAKRIRADGVRAWRDVLRPLDGFRLRLHDWKGEWPCAGIESERLEEFLRFWTPGEHHLAVERRWSVPVDPAERDRVLAEPWEARILDELARLVPVYRFATWSAESDHLFS